MTLAVAKAIIETREILESTSFEDAIRTAISVGGDIDKIDFLKKWRC
ncbi:hypothetical protein [Paratissierella segnis]|jgi:ADP-ribosylglycohydrolase|nr:hypothetical protein [Paratissierella segnis]